MVDISIEKLDEAFVRLHCERHIIYQFSEYYKFHPLNYKYDPRFKSKTWDGYIRLLNSRNHTLPIGLVPDLVEKIEQLGDYSYELDESLFPTIDEDTVTNQLNKLLAKISLHNDEGDKITPEDFQIDSVIHCLTNRRALIISPTSSGKSLITYLMIRYLLATKQAKKILIVVPQISLINQLRTEFNSYGSKDSTWKETYTHDIHDGLETTAPITVSTWQSIWEKSEKYFSQFDAIIVDEAHTAKAKCLSQIMHRSVNAKLRIGMTGTTEEEDELSENTLIGHFGPKVQFVETKELQDRGVVSQLIVECLCLIYSKQDRRDLKKLQDENKKSRKLNAYQTEINFLCAHEQRNNFIANLAKTRKGNTLILVSKVKLHGEPLYKLIKESVGDSKTVYIVDGKVKGIIREEIRQLAEKHSNIIIIATYQIYSTGVNIKNLPHIIFASPSKAKIRILQSIGRVLRRHKNKLIATVYDVVDVMSNSKIEGNYAMRHFRQRLKIYISSHFKYMIHKINLR